MTDDRTGADGSVDVDALLESAGFNDGVSDNAAPVFGSGGQEGAAPGATSDYVPSPSLDEMGGDYPTVDSLLDAFADFDNFRRKEIMKLIFETATRYFQSVAFVEGRIPDHELGREIMGQVVDHSVLAASICLSDPTMDRMFAAMHEKLGDKEDTWKMAITREYRNIQAAVGQ